jgi:hypothetical protein
VIRAYPVRPNSLARPTTSLHDRIATLEIRLQSRTSFQEKLLQLVRKSATKKGTSSMPFLGSWVQRTKSKF